VSVMDSGCLIRVSDMGYEYQTVNLENKRTVSGMSTLTMVFLPYAVVYGLVLLVRT
jgi:hypothetical protein